MRSLIVKGRLSDSEVKVLERDKEIYSNRSYKGTVVDSKGPRYEAGARVCDIYFARYSEFPGTANILQSLLIENYQDIYRDFDYSMFADLQYVKYNEGGFFGMHHDVVKDNNGNDKFRALTMSVNLTHPEDYDGGDLVIYHETKQPDGKRSFEELVRLDRERGSFIIIPAFFLHEAKKVERGSREAIVTWLNTRWKDLDTFKRSIINNNG